MKDLVNLVKEWRTKRGISQATLAQISGVAQNSIGLIERGEVNPSIELLDNLFKALRIEIKFEISDKGKYDVLSGN